MEIPVAGIQMISGAVSGVIADLLTHPFSTVKTRLQVQGATNPAAGTSSLLYSGPIQAFSHIFRTEGIGALYRGAGIVVFAAAPSQALYFGGYETTRRVFGDNPVTNFGAGIVAQFCGSLAWVPMDVVKERLQIEGQVKTEQSYGGSYNAFKNIVKNEGAVGLYRAYWMHQLTWAPFNGLYFAIYEQLKKYLLANPIRISRKSGVNDSENKLGVVDKLICAVASGTIASTATSPIDLVKTRLQVQKSNPDVFDYKVFILIHEYVTRCMSIPYVWLMITVYLT